MNKFWKLTNAVDGSGSTLVLDGPVSQESWWGDEVTPQAFRDELKEINSNKLTVVINSTGGDVWAGVSIHDALKAYDGEVTVKISGLAASIASVIAMAGDKILITPGSTMMIHRASMLAMGNADDLEKAISMLETVEDGIINIYVDRTGQSKEAVKEMLDAETWMSAEKAVELGFADEVLKPKDEEESESLKNMFNGNFAFSMSATKESLENFVGKVTASVEQEEVVEETAPVEEVEVVETPAPEVQPEVVETVVPATEEVETTPEVENNATNKETNMENETPQVIAQTQVLEPKAQAPVNALANPSNYLKTKMALEDFGQVLRANAGKSFEDVKAGWQAQLVKNGLTDVNYFQLPEPVVTSIEDAVKTSGIYSLLNHTGLDVFRVDWDASDPDADTSRGGGHKRGDTKDEQVLDFDKRVIRPQFIYKYLVLNKEDIRENKSTGALMRFVLNELPTRIVREIERAVVIGDGRATNNKRKITSFTSIRSDVMANTGTGNTFAARYTPVVGQSMAENVAKALDLVEADGTVVMIAKKGFGTTARFEKDADGKLYFPLGSSASDVLGVSTIIEPTWFTDATDPDNDAYLVVASAYKTVGDNSIEAFTNFKLETNENEFLQEIYKGGALSARKAAVGIAAVA